MTQIFRPSCPIVLTARDAATGAWIETVRGPVHELARLVEHVETRELRLGRTVLWTST